MTFPFLPPTGILSINQSHYSQSRLYFLAIRPAQLHYLLERELNLQQSADRLFGPSAHSLIIGNPLPRRHFCRVPLKRREFMEQRREASAGCIVPVRASPRAGSAVMTRGMKRQKYLP